jgi:prepilin-type N-terminal cleavage/methylation domain-containing protein
MTVQKNSAARRNGFTIVELLIVIVVIAILAAITVVAYNGIQNRAQTSKINSDFNALSKAIAAAQVQTNGPMKDIVLDSNINGTCQTQPAGTDLASLPRSHACWVRYDAALDKLSIASNMNVRGLVDPWGRPYWIDSNEAEASATDCRKDELAIYARPFNGTSRTNNALLPFVTPACL